MRTLLARTIFLLGLALSHSAQATPALNVQPYICAGCTLFIAWSGISAPSSTDWIGLYTPGAPNGSYIKRQYSTGTASGTISITFPENAAFGSYELRLFTADTFNVIATATITVAPTVGGQVKNGSSALLGATIALDGVPCATSHPGGYGCFVPYGWSGTITASLGGYVFTPASHSVSNVTNGVGSLNFETTTASQVSGAITVLGAPLAGVAMTGSNGASCTATDTSGQYTCTFPTGWSGTIVPTLAGRSFSPPSRNYSSVGASQNSQNYTATVGSNPATLSMQQYVCPGCAHDATWSGIATPSPTDWIGFYAPGAPDYAYLARHNTTGTASGTIPFTLPTLGYTTWGTFELRLFANNARLATTTVSMNPVVLGLVKVNGSDFAGATIMLDGVPCTTTPPAGYWGCIVPAYNWSGTIEISAPGYVFTPASRTATNITTLVTGFDFNATSPTVSGTVTAGGSPLAGVAITGSDGALCNASTDSSGQYTCSVPPGWSGTITPTLLHNAFSPASRSYTNVTVAQTAQNYASSEVYQVSGSAILNGLALANVTFTATNGGTCSTTSGQYACTVPAGWSGTVTPSAAGYSFSPASRNYSSVSTDQTTQGFTATLDTATAPLYFVHVDHLNTPREIYDASQQIRWKWGQQEPFGVNVPDENPSALGSFEFALRFPGQYFDKETNLTQNWFRDYDAALGAYKQSDPIGLRGGLNTYQYVHANPTGATDPTGRLVFVIPVVLIGEAFVNVAVAGIGLAVGALIANEVLGGSAVESRGQNDPVRGQRPFDPGRDCDGKCNRCPPPIYWDAPGDAHGSTGGSHWHGIIWNQDPETCMCYPFRVD
jgi:RHS repeat-associated protein